MPRLFVGTFLPEPERHKLLVDPASNERLVELWERRIRWVRPEKLHLTWLFLGSVDEAIVPEIKAKVADIVRDVAPMDLYYSQSTFCPSSRNARTFVLEPETVPDEVKKLGERCRKELKEYVEEDRLEPKYKPHLTLARMDRGRKRVSLPEWFPPLKHFPLHHHIDRVDLIESHLGASNDYVSIAGWDLHS